MSLPRPSVRASRPLETFCQMTGRRTSIVRSRQTCWKGAEEQGKRLSDVKPVAATNWHQLHRLPRPDFPDVLGRYVL